MKDRPIGQSEERDRTNSHGHDAAPVRGLTVGHSVVDCRPAALTRPTAVAPPSPHRVVWADGERRARHHSLAGTFRAAAQRIGRPVPHHALKSDDFLKPQNLINILQQWSAVGIVAMGMTLVIGAGGIDLSVG